MAVLSETYPHTTALVRLAVERVAADPADEQRYLELNFALDRAVERDLRYRELLELFEEGSARATPSAAWAWKLAAGLSANLIGDTRTAIGWLEQAWESLERIERGATADGSFIHGETARAYYHAGDHAPGVAAANRALQLARAANSLCAEAYAHHYLGLISMRQRDYDYARRHLDAARDLFERMHQRQARSRVQDSLAIIEMETGRYDVARKLLDESLRVKEELRDLRGQAITCGSLARLSAALGNYEEALGYLERKQELIGRVGDERNATIVRVQLGELHLRHGEPDLARIELQAARALAAQRQDGRIEAYTCFVLAEAERLTGHVEAARQAIEQACRYFEPGPDPVMRERARLRSALINGAPLEAPEIQLTFSRLRDLTTGAPLADALFGAASFFHALGLHDADRTRLVTALYAEALDHAEPTQADQMAAALRSRAEGVEGRAWVDAMLTVKRHKDELENAYADLRKAETLRESLVQMIVHDLKNPLTAIMPWLQTIQMGVLSPEESDEYLQMSIDECEYLLRMIEDLNDVGKMQESRLELVMEPLDLPALLADVTRRLQVRARDSGMSIRVLPVPSDLPPLRCDASKLRRVLENLVANGIKYGRPAEGSQLPPEVCVAVYAERKPRDEGGDSVRVEVRDFGAGIPLAEADRVFEPYYQAEAGRRRKAGVGLGLAFCRMVINAHGGAIWTEPNPGGGSIFAFRLPSS